MKYRVAFFLTFTLTAVAANTEPLWSLKEVAELSELLQQAQSRDRFSFLELLDDDDEDEVDDSSSSSSSTESASSEESTSTEASETTSESNNGRRKNNKPNFRSGGGMGPPPRSGSPPNFGSLSDVDDMKWFNAQAFVRWFVRGLASFYEGLVNLMLLPLKIMISFIDV